MLIMLTRFRDRSEAGRRLADELREYAHRSDVVVLALPRGGVPVGYEVAEALDVPLDVFVVRKLGLPGQEELAMGAVATGGVRVLDRNLIRAAGVTDEQLQRVIQEQELELQRRELAYRGDRPRTDLHEKIVILVDDGLATGASMRAAVEAVRHDRPARIVVAVPVAARETCDAFRDIVDEVVCAMTPEPFHAVGLWYEDFTQTTDQDVHDLLEARRAHASIR